MVEVKASYVNLQKEYKNGNKTDYFVYTDLLVVGHAGHTGYTNNIKVCAGISACCTGILRLISDYQFHTEVRSGYFHIWTNKKDLMTLDKDSVYAINTLVCQLYELSKNFPKAFKSFELIDIAKEYENYGKEKSNKQRERTKRWRELNKVGLDAYLEEGDNQEN